MPAGGRSAEGKNRPWLQQHISAAYQVLTRNTKKRKFLSKHRLPLRFPPCLPLCAAVCPLSEWGSVPTPPGGSARIWTAVSPLRRSAYSGHPPPPGLFLEDEKKSRIKAGVAGVTSGRSLRPAVRVVTGFCGVSKVGSKSRRCYHLCGHDPRKATPARRKQGSHTVQSRLYWQKRENSLFFLQRRRHLSGQATREGKT